MKTVLRLLRNDLKRDWKRPWSTLLFAAIPLCLSLLIASIFGGRHGSGPVAVLHVAILDQDKDLISRLLRSLPTQGNAATNLSLHFVESREEGQRLLEQGDASALVVLPEKMTEKLLHGQTNALEFYENPAQQIMPKIVHEGVSLLALGLSSAAEILGDPLREIREMARTNDFPVDTVVGQIASASVQRLDRFRVYLFPAIVEFKVVAAADFVPFSTNRPSRWRGQNHERT